ncbi:MAG: hypothetical protein DRP80_05605 [Candidatus Omnitrophota bacterium]|nr:MAG: hypothetical protein DRP80_05605 [Candidatus Omnitrophota bacterium]
MKRGVLFIVFVLVGSYAFSWDFSKVWGVDDELYSIEVSPFDENILFVGSNRALYKSIDGGKTFRKVLVIKGDSKSINDILFDPYQANLIYLAADSGVYLSKDSGERFSKIFKTVDEQENYIKCLSLAKDRELLYLGTSQGLYLAEENFYKFRRVPNLGEDTQVYDIEVLPGLGLVILASSKGIYLADEKLKSIERVFVARSYKEEGEEESFRNIPQCIYLDRDTQNIYLGTTSGLFVSKDRGKTWQRLNFAGLNSLNIKQISKAPNKNILYLATEEGLYELNLKDRILNNILKGASSEVRDLAWVKGVLFLATSSGLYKRQSESSELGNNIDFENEPSYLEVQEKALNYNHLHPDIIKDWKKRVRLRALFPNIDVDYYKSISYGIAQSYERWSVGPRDWSVGLSWDIGDLIWNSYEDDIDSRARLDTQTRLDLLDDLRRIYFERRRVKLELIKNPPQDGQELLKKKLYLEELTAGLDAYTGGWFSQEIKGKSNYNE